MARVYGSRPINKEPDHEHSRDSARSHRVASYVTPICYENQYSLKPPFADPEEVDDETDGAQ